MQNQIVWVDIPIMDLDRAIKFYSAVLDAQITKQSFPGGSFGLLPHTENNTSGCLVKSEDNKPSQTGPLIYLNVEGRIESAIAAVKAHGGQVVQDTHPIGEHGYRAIILDSEGNKIALHSAKAQV